MYAHSMREPTYFVLAALLDGPLHGYAIAQRAQERVGRLEDPRVGHLVDPDVARPVHHRGSHDPDPIRA